MYIMMSGYGAQSLDSKEDRVTARVAYAKRGRLRESSSKHPLPTLYSVSGVQKMADCHVALIATDRKSRIIKGYQNTNT